jgi:hypothetical protein
MRRALDGRIVFAAALFPASILLFTAIFTIIGCVSNYGSVRSDTGVRLTFVKHQVVDDHTYYYYGFAGEPDAIVGIRNDYTLESDLWKKIDFSKNSFQVMVDRVGSRNSSSRSGYSIYDPQKNRIGIMLSGGGGATVKMAGEKRIAFISVRSKAHKRFNDR